MGLSKKFELTRGMFMKIVSNLDEKTIDVQPEGFNNTIRWHIGHVLTTAEQMMFGFPERSSHLPATYIDMFKMGSRPSKWGTDIPKLEELIGYLESQASRIRELPNELFSQKLPFQFPMEEIQSFGDMYEFMLFHEAYHLGQIQAMKRIVEASK